MKPLTVTLFLLFLVSSLPAARPVPGVDRNPFGSQTVWPENPQLDTFLNRLQEMKVHWARFDLCWWGLAETSPGVYNFNPPAPNVPGGTWGTDAMITKLHARGIEPFPILNYGNPLYDNNQGPFSSAGRTAFGNFCYAAALRYKDTVSYWEIWNEPNLAQFWGRTPSAADYAELVKVAAARIKEANPDAWVVGGVTSGIDQTFLQGCIDNGMLTAVDAITVHPYRIDRPETINSEITSLRSRISAATAKNIPVWSGEWGYNSAWSEIDEVGQAKMLSRMMTNNLAQGITLSLWFSEHPFAEYPEFPNDPQWGLLNYNLTPRPSYYAMRTINERLPAPVAAVADPFVISLSPTLSGQRVFVFQRAGGVYTIAIWQALAITASSSGPTTQVGLTLSAGSTLQAWEGLNGTAVTLSPSNAGARTLLNGFRVWDYPTFIDITVPPVTPSPSPSPSLTASLSPSPSSSPSPSPSPSSSPSPSPSASPSPTAPPVPTPPVMEGLILSRASP